MVRKGVLESLEGGVVQPYDSLNLGMSLLTQGNKSREDIEAW